MPLKLIVAIRLGEIVDRAHDPAVDVPQHVGMETVGGGIGLEVDVHAGGVEDARVVAAGLADAVFVVELTVEVVVFEVAVFEVGVFEVGVFDVVPDVVDGAVD